MCESVTRGGSTANIDAGKCCGEEGLGGTDLSRVRVGRGSGVGGGMCVVS